MKLIKTCNFCGKKLDKPALVNDGSTVKCGHCLVKEIEQNEKMYCLNEFLEKWK